MTTILLCGKSDDNAIGKLLLDALVNYGGMQFYDGARLIRVGKDHYPEFFLYESEKIPQTKSNSGILLFKNSFRFETEQPQKISSEFIPVFESHNTHAAAALKGTGIVGVTCGTSPKDVLSIASLSDTGATVSLQRNVKILTGEVLEPLDITLQFKNPVSPFPLLAACSVLLLSGIPSNSEFCF
jgi:hypothetical protein